MKNHIGHFVFLIPKVRDSNTGYHQGERFCVREGDGFISCLRTSGGWDCHLTEEIYYLSDWLVSQSYPGDVIELVKLFETFVLESKKVKPQWPLDVYTKAGANVRKIKEALVARQIINETLKEEPLGDSVVGRKTIQRTIRQGFVYPKEGDLCYLLKPYVIKGVPYEAGRLGWVERIQTDPKGLWHGCEVYIKGLKEVIPFEIASNPEIMYFNQRDLAPLVGKRVRVKDTGSYTREENILVLAQDENKITCIKCDDGAFCYSWISNYEIGPKWQPYMVQDGFSTMRMMFTAYNEEFKRRAYGDAGAERVHQTCIDFMFPLWDKLYPGISHGVNLQ